jgi:hypothetical protein
MFGFFKTEKQKQYQEALEAFIDRIAHASAETQAAIHALEALTQPRAKLFAATIIKNLVMRRGRTLEAAQELRRQAQEANGLFSKYPTAIAATMIECGVYLAKLDGPSWTRGSMAFAHLEGMIRGFLQRQGVQEWEVMYAYDIEFESYRQSWMMQNPIRESVQEDDGGRLD